MIAFDEVAEIIDSYSEGPDYLGRVHPDEIATAEKRLEVSFPRSYKDFLERYGCGNLGCEIYGVGVPETRVPNVVWYTLSEREEGFIPEWMVIVCVEDEHIFCLDTSTFNENGECKVVSWILGLPFDAQPFRWTYTSFADFLYECVREAIDGGWWR